jgi:outer membrane protein OmpA-like peptidoglycan-associated protein
MKLTVLALSLGALTSTTLATQAPRLEGTTGIGISVGGQRYDGSYGDNTMPYYRAHLEHHIAEDFAFRAIGGYGNISNGSSEFRTAYFYNLGLQGVLQPRINALGIVRPYLATGVSSDFGKVNSYGTRVFDLNWNVYVPVEIGVELLVSEELSLTAFLENRVHSVEWDKLDGVRTGDNYFEQRDELPRAGLGLTIHFGGTPTPPPAPARIMLPPAPVVPVAAPLVIVVIETVDSDKDGVVDSKDKCSNTPPGAKIDSLGCPLDADKDGVADHLDNCTNTPSGVQVASNGCPIDNDADGIADYLDRCTNTPAGVKIDEAGCPIDIDKDGVPDYLDLCQNTPKGVKIDSSGCMEIKIVKGTKLTIDGIFFSTAEAEIDTSSAPTLSRAAKALKLAPKARVEIAGFTDNVGGTKANKTLSNKRAAAVRNYLIDLGVPAKQISSKGYGMANPIADNRTVEGRAKNRRIEFRVK